jgi:hypothetical protein
MLMLTGAKCRAGELLGVTRGERIVARRDCVGVADPAVTTVSDNLTATSMLDDLAGAADRL